MKFVQKFRRSRPARREAGQGLVEYALILALVVIVVIVILAMFGSAVRGMYGTVVSSLNGATGGGATATATAAPSATPAPTATPVVTWTLCANENQTCTIPAGSHLVRYGKNGTYTGGTYTGPTSFPCTNAFFGNDPLQGTIKECDYQ